ncbi:NADH:flavin oxidoreductase [Candidatus Poribacteria bacterium]|nr:NADH:flavin oxidoreductase [Candidatus Poribacteria bacterium]
MRKYFTYKTLEMLAEDITALGLDIQLDTDLAPCFEPIEVGGRRVGNRLAIHPMEGCDGTRDGKPGDLTIRRWLRFGEGGAKLVWGEATAVTEESRANTRQLLINERNLPSLASLLKQTRAAHRRVHGDDGDFLVGLQLTHSGRYSYRKPLIAAHDPVVDSVTVADKKTGTMVDGSTPLLTDDDLRRVEDDLVNAARLAARAGFDFVDIKQCHRYLLSELLSARRRPGEYGGSFENRTRLARNVIGRLRDELGDRIIVATRLNVYDGIPYRLDPETKEGVARPVPTPYLGGWGTDADDPTRMDLSEPVRYAQELAEMGVAMINVTMGSPYYNPHVGRPFERPPTDAYTTPEHPLLGVARHFAAAEAIHRAAPNVVAIGTGYSWLQHYLLQVAAANLRTDRVSMVGVGRGALAYPDFVRDAMEHGEMSRHRACVAVSYCTALMRGKHNELGQFPAGCVPRDEPYAAIYKDMLATDPKKA